MAANTMHAYFIQCITNMHVGSGDANYGVVDKLVQRDVVTNHPTIHASSLKGGLREHFKNAWKGDIDKDKVIKIFGADPREGQENMSSGAFTFLSADLVALPVRSNFYQYALCTSVQLLEDLNKRCKTLMKKDLVNVPDSQDTFFTNQQSSYDVYLEDEKVSLSKFQPLLKSTTIDAFADRYAVVNDEKFAAFITNLPVVARNNLVEGVSKNLWYEEVVPHQTLFITWIAAPANDLLSEFETVLNSDIIQVGANASIGYGLCKFTKIQFA